MPKCSMVVVTKNYFVDMLNEGARWTYVPWVLAPNEQWMERVEQPTECAYVYIMGQLNGQI